VARKRSHLDGCAAAHALDLIGERWALLVVRELLLGPKRFTDLRTGIPDISPNVLGQRLRELEANGVLRRRKLAPPAASRVYELTDWGYELEPVVVGLGRWGSRSPTHPLGGELSVASLVLALKADFDPVAAGDLSATYELRLGEESFRAEVVDGRLEVARGIPTRPDATIETDARTLQALIFEGRRLSEATRSGALSIEGDRSAVKRFLGLFPVPQRAPLPTPA
jgi:DNA-binding HxlR family transcriptional regulator